MTAKTKIVDILSHKNLTVFKQHGFVPIEAVGSNQVRGYSIFSGKDKFYVNPETKMWDCKNSPENNGGYQQFLQQVHAMAQNNFKGKYVGWLARDRGLLRSTLKEHRIGYNPHNDSYVIPIPDATNSKLWDLSIYSKRYKKLQASAGTFAGLYGWENLQKFDTIWLVEGQWDKLAMWEILYKTNRLKSETVISVPGAGTFKTEWHVLFKNKKVYVAYDADRARTVSGVPHPGAGPAGTMKVMKALTGIVKELKFVHWPEDVKDGYDVSDNLIECNSNHEQAYSKMCSYLETDCTLEDEFRKDIIEENKTDAELFTGPRIPAKKVYDTYKKWLYLPDTTVIDVLFGTAIANRLPGDPLWMFIVAPSGGTKTVFMMSIAAGPKIMSTTTMTPHSLVSGANFAGGNDPSLIPKLDGRILTIKDFTTILNMNQQHREEIFGILRDAYDGKTEKMFGNGVFRSYSSKFGIIAGVTHAIELFTDGQTALGERFLRYKLKIGASHTERIKYLRRAMLNANIGSTMDNELEEIGTAVLSYNYKDVPIITPALQERLLYIAQWTAVMRGTISRDPYSKEVMAKPFVELGTRLIKQFTKLLMGIGMFRNLNTVTRNEFKIVRDIAISSVPGDMNEITRYLYKEGKHAWRKHDEIVKATRLPSENCRRKLENLCMLDVLRKDKQGFKYTYSLNKDMLELLEEGRIYRR